MGEAAVREEEHNVEKRQRPSVNVGDGERKASMVGGAALAVTGMAALRKRRVFPALAMMAAGGMLLYRGKSGHCSMYQALGINTATEGITLEKMVTVNRPRQEVYDFWHDVENLPKFMKNLESVRSAGNGHTHWVARLPGGATVEWDAETVDDRPGETISWRSVEGSELPNRGMVEFRDAPQGRGTEVKVRFSFTPPGGAAGQAAATLTDAITAQQIEEDMKRFKQVMETGEIATAAER